MRIEAQMKAKEQRSTDNNQPPHYPEDGIEVEQITSMSDYLFEALQENEKDRQKKEKDY
jgi:hypothetical protein